LDGGPERLLVNERAACCERIAECDHVGVARGGLVVRLLGDGDERWGRGAAERGASAPRDHQQPDNEETGGESRHEHLPGEGTMWICRLDLPARAGVGPEDSRFACAPRPPSRILCDPGRSVVRISWEKA